MEEVLAEMVAASRTCAHCAAEVPAENRFCEECGAAIEKAAVEAGPVCPKCSAEPGEIDEEGFCTGCGLRREARGRDHFEITLRPEFAGVSDRGLRHHRNEDFFALSVSATADALNPRAVLIVCDGVSSSRDADVASQIATECVSDLLRSDVQPTDVETNEQRERALNAAIASAQEAVSAIPFQGGSEQDRPATTIVVAVVEQAQVTVSWLGDSRAYWISDAEARQLTRDDSWRNEIVQAGEMSEAEADESKNAHAITRWLGAGAAEMSPSIVHFEIPGPGRLLLCTDGLWNYAATPESMFNLIGSIEGEALAVTRGLVEFAKSKGGQDNITAALLCLPLHSSAESASNNDSV